MERSRSWSDLGPRLAAGGFLAAFAAIVLWFGGWVVWLLLLGVAAAMIWEVVMMLRQGMPQSRRFHVLIPMIAFVILGAAFGLAMLLTGDNSALGIWLIVVVVVTDIAGYFGGKSLGGPKLAPRLSPKKTWAGTISGWSAAVLFGGFGAMVLHIEGGVVLWAFAALIVSIFAQAGDLAESALKRRLGAKDSSHLIPGHGGFCDRFDGLVGGYYGLVLALSVLPLSFGVT